MRRRLFPILAAVSLALAIGVMGLWARSYWHVGHLQYVMRTSDESVRRVYFMRCGAGAVEIFASDDIMDDASRSRPRPQVGWTHSGFPRDSREYPSRDGLGFAWYIVRPGGHSQIQVRLPCWCLVIVLLTAPGLWLRRFRAEGRREERQRLGLCLACGYDLRAHVSGQLCPECGSAVPADLIRKPMG